jgi:hypothetical protein
MSAASAAAVRRTLDAAARANDRALAAEKRRFAGPTVSKELKRVRHTKSKKKRK